jgi:hypothetical protein
VTDFPTARTMLPNDSWLCVFVWCTACHHQAPADLRAIIDAGRGDVPVKDLKFRCTSCSSALTDFVIMSRDSLRVQPWRADDVDYTSRAAGHLRGQRPWR